MAGLEARQTRHEDRRRDVGRNRASASSQRTYNIQAYMCLTKSLSSMSAHMSSNKSINMSKHNVCKHAYAHVHAHACVHACVHMSMRACSCTRLCTRLHTCPCTCLWAVDTHVHAHVYAGQPMTSNSTGCHAPREYPTISTTAARPATHPAACSNCRDGGLCASQHACICTRKTGS